MVTHSTLKKISENLELPIEVVKQTIKEKYKDGYTLEELASETGVGITTIVKILDELKVQRRNRGEGRHYAIVRRVEESEDGDIKSVLTKLYEETGFSVRQLSIRWKISDTAVKEMLFRHGFIIRNCREAAERRAGR